MTGILEYLDWRNDVPFEIAPFNDADCLVLARLAYVPFEDVVAFDGLIRVDEAARRLLAAEDVHQRVPREEDFSFLSLLQQSDRFGSILLSRYVSHLDEKQEKQFAALTADVGPRLRVVLYRGTDNTLVGWKEDLNMAFMVRVPSQLEAAAYLDAAYDPNRRFILCGHSKGGNLAVYAAAFANPVVQDCIERVCNFDGPGFYQEVLQSQGYRRIAVRVRSYVPQTSVIGMLLDHEEAYTIVHSMQSGLMQHDMYSWQMRRDGFVCLDTVTDASRFIDRTLHDWLARLEPSQREAFVDAMFYVLANMQGDSVSAVMNNKYKNLHIAVKTVRDMDPEMRKPMMQVLGALLKCVQNNAKLMLSGGRTHGDAVQIP